MMINIVHNSQETTVSSILTIFPFPTKHNLLKTVFFFLKGFIKCTLETLFHKILERITTIN